MNDVVQKRLSRSELVVVAKLLAAWPYIDSATQKLVAEYPSIRFPTLHRLIEKIADPQFRIPKGDEFDILSQMIEDCFGTSLLTQSLQMTFLPQFTQIQRDLSVHQPPYNLVSIQRKLLQGLQEYLSEQYRERSETILEDIRQRFPELRDQTNEILRLNKVFYLKANEGPHNFKELELYAREKFQRGVSFVVSTGFMGIDQKINEGGYVPQRLTVLEAQTGLGKTSLVSQTLCQAALLQHQGALLLSLEMDKESSMYRMLAQATKIPVKDLEKMLRSEAGATPVVRDFINRLNELVYIEYPNIKGDINYIESKILDYTREFGQVPALIVIDYIQQLSMGTGGRFVNRSEELTEISRTLRSLAQQFNAHIIVASQAMETSDGLRSFGASGIEFAADHVLVLSQSKTNENRRILKFKKNRFGPSGDEIELFWNGKLTSFFELNGNSLDRDFPPDYLPTFPKESGDENFWNGKETGRIPF